MAYIEPIKVVAAILKSEMSLANERVVVYNQKWTLPNDSDIFISLGLGTSKVFANRNSTEDREAGFYEVQEINVRESIVIDILSKDSTARERKEEILLALRSVFSQQQQEINSLKIANIPDSFNDISVVEAAARLNRYNITIGVLSWRKKEKVVEYYDSYEYEVETNK